jgi:hypothetical protein
MKTKRWLCQTLAAAILLSLLATGDTVRADDSSRVTAGTVLELMFSRVRTRGLLQQKSLDELIQDSKRHLQVAFVVDGTDSMGRDIEGVLESLKFFVGQLREAKGNDNVAFNLVVYRDRGAESGLTSMPLGEKFTESYSELEDAVAAVRTETGRPYFPEVPDMALYDALNQLDWMDQDVCTRWLILFADAPPYKEGFVDADSGARRHFTTEQLVTRAKENEVRISAILCNSGFTDEEIGDNKRLKEAYEKAKPLLEEFMTKLTEETGGVMWDLSDEQLRDKLAQAARERRENEQAIRPITPEDVERARSDDLEMVRLVVLPHLPLKEMTFESDHEAVMAATDIRERLRRIPGIDTVNPTKVQDAFEKLASRSPSDTSSPQSDGDLLSELAIMTDADYVVWGQVSEADGKSTWMSGLHKKVDGSNLFEVSEVVDSSSERGQLNIGYVVADELAKEAAKSLKNANADHAALFARVSEAGAARDDFKAPITNNPRARREILRGLDRLEQALGYPRAHVEAEPNLLQAKAALEAAGRIDSQNPFVQLLLASAYYNLAAISSDRGDANADDLHESFKEALGAAYEMRDDATHELVKTEIEADHALLIERDFVKAFEKYQSLLTAPKDKQLRAQVRAHWMLAGMYCGDWGVDAQLIDPEQGREHLVALLADFEHTPEADFVRSYTLWDDKDGTINPGYRRDNHTLFADTREP